METPVSVVTSDALSLPALRLDRAPLLDLATAVRREWLVTNGIGGYASGTVIGVDTRRYHGLLMAALRPPVGRTLLLARLRDTIEVAGDRYPLHTAEYHDETIDPLGYLFLEEFSLDGQRPVWRYRCHDVEIEKTLWLASGRNTTFVAYRLLAAPGPVILRIEPFVTHRDDHSQTHGDPAWRFAVDARPDGCRVHAFSGAAPLWLRLIGGRFAETGIWYWRFLHRRERERGLDALEDLYTPGVLDVEMTPGEAATFIATTDLEDRELDPLVSDQADRKRQWSLLQRARATAHDPALQRLVLAADQFLVARGTSGRSVIAGYHWFTDWGRDTMIALPGLCLATGRFDEARAIIQTFAGFLDHGLLPNRFPDRGEAPEYNTADATLWLVETLARYERATGDHALVGALLPGLVDIVAWHQRGTRHGIGVDPHDGLLKAGEPGLALTWMDARVGDWAVTPRRGKPVEIQALWYNALRLLEAWLSERGEDATGVVVASARCWASFNWRFWNAELGSCFDVVDGPTGDEPSLRPNQLIAASLTHPVLDPSHWRALLETVERTLLTPFGLRTLTPSDPAYVGSYAGDQLHRDGAYHQGTIWPWLIGPYVDVARRVRGVDWDVRSVLDGLARHLGEAGLGQVSEIFGGDPPHPPVGCVAQAWSVGELLRVWPRSDEKSPVQLDERPVGEPRRP